MDKFQKLLIELIEKYNDLSMTMACDVVDDMNSLLIQYLKDKTTMAVWEIYKQDPKEELQNLQIQYERKYEKPVPFRYKNSISRIQSKL